MLPLRCALAFLRSRREQAIVELALRQQLATYAQKRSRPTLTPLDRAFWVALSRFWPGWKDAAPQGLPPLLAGDLEAWSRAATDL
jgi:hypothetical protein